VGRFDRIKTEFGSYAKYIISTDPNTYDTTGDLVVGDFHRGGRDTIVVGAPSTFGILRRT
jgi:hypothetical protein